MGRSLGKRKSLGKRRSSRSNYTYNPIEQGMGTVFGLSMGPAVIGGAARMGASARAAGYTGAANITDVVPAIYSAGVLSRTVPQEKPKRKRRK